MKNKLEYHDFWDVFMDEYLPSKISNEWLVQNDSFVEETVNMAFRNYELSDMDDKIAMRFLSEFFLLTFLYFKDFNIY